MRRKAIRAIVAKSASPTVGFAEDSRPMSDEMIAFPAHALLILEERLKEQESKGVEMPAGMARDELALRIVRRRRLT
jgi:hypothetical protein